jgi:hypothetical protein
MPPHPTFLRSVLILSSHLRRGLPNGLIPSDFPSKTLYETLLSPTYYMPYPSQSYWCYHPNDILRVQSIKLLVMQSSPLPCNLFPLRPKHVPVYNLPLDSKPLFFFANASPFVTNGSHTVGLRTLG